MRWLLLASVGCGFRPGVAPGDAPEGDAAADALDAAIDAAPPAICAPDPNVTLCFTFDQDPPPAMQANQGTAVVDATLTSVKWTAHDTGGAVLLDTTSEIFVPMASDVTNVHATEIWYRFDGDVPDGGRSGLVDSNVIPPNISLFVYRNGTTYQAQCGLGDATARSTIPVALGQWYYFACICNGPDLQAYLDGVLVGDVAAPCDSGGALTSDGITFGANNQGLGQPVNDWLVGAIAAVRISKVAPTPQQICTTAGKAGC